MEREREEKKRRENRKEGAMTNQQTVQGQVHRMAIGNIKTNFFKSKHKADKNALEC